MQKFTRGNIDEFIRKHVGTGRALNIGSGGVSYNDIFPDLVTIDIDPARKPDIVGSAEALPFPDESFDQILCSEVLEHIENPTQAIAEMYRVLRPNGIVILTTRFAFPVHDAPGDYWRFTPYGLAKLFNKFTILEQDVEGTTFEALGVLLQRVIFQTEVRGGKLTKGILYGLALLLNNLSFLVRHEYGDIARTVTVPQMLTSGVYLVGRKN